MSTDPARLLAAQNADPLERKLLLSLRGIAPPAGADAEAWQGLRRQLVLAGLVGAALSAPKAALAASSSVASSSVASSSLSGSAALGAGVEGAATGAGLLTKSALGNAIGASLKAKLLLSLSVGALGLGALAVGVHFSTSATKVAAQTTTERVPLPPLHAPTLNAASNAASPANTATLAVPEPASLQAAPAVAASPAQQSDALARESALLVRARGALRASDIASARALLTELQARFPRGVLGQEREVLNIEVLAASGAREAAARRAKRFVAQHPTSPHTAALARFVDGH